MDVYPPGTIRLYYRAVGSRSDADPTASVTRSDFSVLPGPGPRNLGDGAYCFEFGLNVEGSYLVRFYENGVMTTIQHIEVRRDNNKPRVGDKLINT